MRRTNVMRHVSEDAKRAGLFLLYHKDGRWEYLSARSGKSVLTWFQDSGRWTTPRDDSGTADSPFGALHAAVAQEKHNIPLANVDSQP